MIKEVLWMGWMGRMGWMVIGLQRAPSVLIMQGRVVDSIKNVI